MSGLAAKESEYMAIRAFISTWTELDRSFESRLGAYLRNVSLSDPGAVLQNYWARRAADNRPDKLFLIEILEGNLTDAEWATLAGLDGTNMVPPNRFDKALNTLPRPVENQIKAAMGDYSIPLEVYDSSPTLGALLRNILEYMNPDLAGFGAREERPEDWA